LQTLTRPTRITSHSAKLIDHSVTNAPDSVADSFLILTDISDHFPVLQKLKLNLKCNATVDTKFERDFSKRNINNFKTALNANDWTPILACNEAQNSFNIFENHFNGLFNLFFPKKQKRLNKNFDPVNKWFTSGLLVSRRTLQNLFKQQTKNNSPVNVTSYKKILETCIIIQSKPPKNFFMQKS